MQQGSAYWARPSFTMRGRRAVNGLKHGVALADVGAAGGADAALELGRLVGDDVAVQVGQNKHLEIACGAFRRSAWRS